MQVTRLPMQVVEAHVQRPRVTGHVLGHQVGARRVDEGAAVVQLRA